MDGWGKTTFGHVQREIRMLNDRLSVLRADGARMQPSYEETKITERLVDLYQREEVMWH
jgi:hypothetical protein